MTSGRIKEVCCPAGVIIFIMPFEGNSYFAHGAFSHHVVTCQSLASYDQARDSTHQYPCLYPSLATITLHMENDEGWYNHASVAPCFSQHFESQYIASFELVYYSSMFTIRFFTISFNFFFPLLCYDVIFISPL